MLVSKQRTIYALNHTTVRCTGMSLQVAERSQLGDTATTSIHSLQQRLAPYGFERGYGDSPHDFNGRLCLDNLFARQLKIGSAHTCRFEPTYINLDPYPLEDLPPMPTQQRVDTVTVVYSDGSEAPVTYGIPIDWYATNQQLLDGVRRQCNVTGDEQIVLVLLENNLLSRYLAL